MASSVPEQPGRWPTAGERSTEEIAREQGVRPIASLKDIEALAQPDAYESEKEFTDFLADLYTSRRSGA